ncbi:hypothetical protein DB32_004955 [Sandaracinus amylolyticus]|uniref:Uncharacterized protein n=1 Tax=Sandaracinus amylolyticus TaxID=927083 RepID=A0A0F6W584_9BACT|nr:hypothetical protein DB32_004955 [Sandaracinus amylolyticus]
MTPGCGAGCTVTYALDGWGCCTITWPCAGGGCGTTTTHGCPGGH